MVTVAFSLPSTAPIDRKTVQPKKSTTDPDDNRHGFKEVGLERGLDFVMSFLPDRESKTLKTNLYDHGCGLAVADYDGDGHEDVYLLNQIGENGLFRNRGDGTFVEDKEAKKVIGLGDRISVGCTFSDYDNDGDQDLYVTSTRSGNVLFQNDGKGKFKDVTKQAGLTHIGHSQSAAFFDYDNDGHLDLLLTNAAKWTTDLYIQARGYYAGLSNIFEMAKSPKEYNILYRNDGQGKFTDVTKKAGLVHVGHSQSAAFFDYDHDGDLDLLLTNAAKWTTDLYRGSPGYYAGLNNIFEMSQSPKEYNILYRNNGNGTFSDATESSGLKGQGWCGDIAVFDYDEDGDLDVILTNMFAISRLFENDGKGKFKDVTISTLKKTSFGAIGVRAFDYNNDGRLDIFFTDMHSDMWMPAHYSPARIQDTVKHTGVTGPLVLDEPQKELDFGAVFKIKYKESIFGNSFFQNNGKGKFEEISDKANLETFWPWGIATGDFDNNGFMDIFIPSGMGVPYFYWRNYLMMNDGKGRFADKSRSQGIEPPPGGRYLEKREDEDLFPKSSRCAVTADFDGDGQIELIVNNYNDRAFYFHNNYPKQNYLSVRLQGTKSNRDAIGALVYLHAADVKMVRQVHPASGYLSHSSKVLHFGLGKTKSIDRLEILWPSGIRQTVKSPKINQRLSVKEAANKKAAK